MALNQLGLGFLFTAKDLASGTMNRLRGNFGTLAGTTAAQGAVMNKAFAGITAGLGLVGAGFGGLALGFEAANAFGKFEQSLAAVGAVTKATPAQMKLLKDSAVEAGIATQFSPDEATQGLLSLATAGQTAEQATKTLIPVLDLAAGSLGQLGVAEAADAVVGTLNAYGIAASEATGVTDKLLRITQLTNFQTKDFEAGLAKAAASGATFGQSLDDVLVGMGLLRNRNIDASSSATALREATRRLGSDQNAQKAITEKGVDIFDKQTGKMRSIIDVTQDFIDVTKDLNDEEKGRRVVQAFGARGLLAFNAIQQATFTTMRDGVEVTLKGRDAIEALRGEIAKSEGTAKDFTSALLDTFEGQKTLLKGSLQTLAITSGEAFAKTFKPVVSVIIKFVNALISVVTNTPQPLKALVIGALGVISTFLVMGGGITFVVASIALLLPVLKVVAVIFGILLVAMLPVIAAVGTIAFLFFGLSRAGAGATSLADTVKGAFDKIVLAGKALAQFFNEGKISGDVARELQKTQNAGVLAFVDRVVRAVQNVQNFFKGLGEGFDSGLKRAQPAIDKLKQAFDGLLTTLSSVFGGKADPTAASERFDKFGKKGFEAGNKLADAFAFLANAVATALKGLDLIVQIGNKMAPLFRPISDDLRGLGDTFKGIIPGLGPGDAAGEWNAFKLIVAFAFGFIASGIRTFIAGIKIMGAIVGAVIGLIANQIATVVGITRGMVTIIQGIIEGNWSKVWLGMKQVVASVVKGIIGIVAQLVIMIAKSIDALGRLANKDFGATAKATGFADDINRSLDKFAGAEVEAPSTRPSPAQEQEIKRQENEIRDRARTLVSPGAIAAAPTVTAAEAAAGAPDFGAQMAQFNQAVQQLNRQRPPVQANIKVELDGEVIKQKTVEATDTGFAPGGAPAGV